MVWKSLPTVDLVGQIILESSAVKETRAIASELCRNFYSLGWVSGTGGSISMKDHEDSVPKLCQLIIMSPSGVQKEGMVPEDLHVLSSDGLVLSSPPRKPPKCTDSATLFLKIYYIGVPKRFLTHEIRNAGAVIHSHAVESCLVTMINPCSKEFRMIKGIQGHGYNDELVVPIIENTAHEGELIDTFTKAVIAYPKTTDVLLRNHSVYIWGDSWISAKTQVDAAIKLHHLGMYKSTPRNIAAHDVNRSCGCGGKTSRVLKRGDPCIDNVIEASHPCILLDIEAIMTPISSVTDIPLFIGSNLVTHLTSSHGSVETQHDITLLSPQRNAWSIGFERNALAGAIFGDISHALERWHASDIKVYIFSSGSREAEQFILAKSNYGSLRKYFCGFFGTSMGYTEIVRTVGVDRPRDMLFVTTNLHEVDAAKAAGLEVMISIRPGNESLPENFEFPMIVFLGNMRVSVI